MKKLLSFLFIFTSFLSFSQTVVILDKETNEPLPDVMVYNENQTKIKYSGTNGKVDITDFLNNDILTFSLAGFIEYEILKRDIPQLNNTIYLVEESQSIGEVLIYSASKGAENRKRLAEQIILTPQKEIERQMPQTSADFLASIPSIKVQKSQFGGGSPVLRGMEANRVLLVVDGVRMNNAIYRKGHLQNAITVSPTILQKTEVVYGPSSVLYGSDALGGVIHYYTKKPKIASESAINGTLFSRYGSVNNESTSSIGLSYSSKKVATYTSFSYATFGDLRIGKVRPHDYENWGKQFEYSNNTNTFYNANAVENSNPNKLKNTGYNQLDFLQKVLVPLNEKTDLSFNFQYSNSSNINRFDRLQEYKDGNLKFAEWYYGPQKRLMLSSQLSLKPQKNWLDKGTITVAYQNVKESRVQRKFNSLDRSYRNEAVDVYSINGDFSVPLSTSAKRILSYGFEVAHNDVASHSEGKILNIQGNEIIGFDGNFNVQSRYPDGGSTYTTASLYANYRQDINEKSTLNTGLRFTDTYLSAKWNDETFITLPSMKINLSNSAVTGTIGYVYKPNENLQLNANLASGFRSPNIDDIGKVREKNGFVTVPNINLRPEYAYSAELGALKYFNNKKFYIGWNMYYTLLDNYIIREAFTLNGNTTIEFDGEEGDIVANVNKGNAYIIGSTFSFKGKLTDKWSTNGSVTFTKGKTYDTNEPLSSIPPLFGNATLSYTHKKLENAFSVVFNARKKAKDYNISEGIDNIEESPQDLSGNFLGTPSWYTLNYYAKYALLKQLDLQFAVSNILDHHYQEFASGISAPGRNISVALRLKF